MPGKHLVTRPLGSFLVRWLLALLFLVLPVHACLAHPMGNFSVNHYTKITLEQDGIQLQYFIDLAEIPTYQEMQQYNVTQAEPAAAAPFVAIRGAELEKGLGLSIDGTATPLRMVSKGVIFPPGAGGLPTMKLGYVFRAAYPHGAGTGANLAFTDNNYPGHAGWKEIVVAGPPSFSMATSAPSRDRSAELSNYPTDMLNSPPQDLSATVRFTIPPAPAPQIAASPAVAPHALQQAATAATRQTSTSTPLPKIRKPIQPSSSTAATPDRLAAHVHTPASIQPAPGALAQPVPVAPVPIAPMHLQANKQGTAHDAFTQLVSTQHLSLWFLITAAFISAGLGALHALEPGHGKTIVAAYLVGSRGTARHALLLGIIVTVAHTASVFALGAVTLYASRYILPEQLYPWLGLLSGFTIAGLGGYMFLQRWTGQAMDHSHAAGEMHGHWFSSKSSTKSPSNNLQTGVERDSPATDVNGTPVKAVSLTQLLTLGITGGIIPCPTALVVLLSAFALHRVGFGFFLISAFSVGLAAVLIGFGMLMVYARQFMARFKVDGPLTKRWLPVASAAFMTILGLVIAARAFATTGLTLHSFSQQRLGPALFVAGLGLVLGIRHSTDTDHVVAISTIVTRQRSIRGAALIGSLWGLGHTLTIFAVGCLIILFGVVIPPRVGLSMEFSVALMLILLGVLNLTGMTQTIVARLRPGRNTAPPLLPAQDVPLPSNTAVEQTQIAPADKIRFATVWRHRGSYGLLLRPLVIGLVHGLAGSAAIALLVLSTIHNPLWAIVYLLIFGGGTMLGMMGMTVAMALPLVYAGDRMPQVSRYLGVASGLVSVCFGCFLVYQLGYLGGLFTSHPHWTPQ